MVYKWISVDTLISDIETTHQIKSAEYIQLLPFWIPKALKALRVRLPLEPNMVKLEVENGLAMLPTDCHIMSILVMDGVPILRTDKNLLQTIDGNDYNEVVTSQIPVKETTTNPDGSITVRTIPENVVLDYGNGNSPYEYLLHHNGNLEFSFETGVVELYYFRIPTYTDEQTGVRIAMIPDTELCLENIKWFVLRNILYRGYKHPLLNLNSANHYVNPAIMYEKTAAAAANSLKVWDSEKYNAIDNVMTAIFKNVDYLSRNFNT